MNWEILGVIAEIVAAIAVVVSLVYLAIQVRDNSNQSSAATSSDIIDQFNRMQEVLISSPDIIHLLTKMKTEDELTPDEDTLLESTANRYLTHWYAIEMAHERKLVDNTVYSLFCEDVERCVIRYPGMHRKFLEIAEFFSIAREIPIYEPIFRLESQLGSLRDVNERL